MSRIEEIAKSLKVAFEQGTYDPMVEQAILDTIEYLEQEQLKEEEDEYIDPSELGGCCGGHWADENMIPMEE